MLMASHSSANSTTMTPNIWKPCYSMMTCGLISKSRCKMECWRWSHCTGVEMTFNVIQAHRVLLASSSPYFKVGFTNFLLLHFLPYKFSLIWVFKREKRKFNLSRPCSQVVWRSPNGQRRTEELFRLIGGWSLWRWWHGDEGDNDDDWGSRKNCQKRALRTNRYSFL